MGKKLQKELEKTALNTSVVIGSAKLSMCCNASVGIRNTINNIPCYYCHKCDKLTGVIDEYGNRAN